MCISVTMIERIAGMFKSLIFLSMLFVASGCSAETSVTVQNGEVDSADQEVKFSVQDISSRINGMAGQVISVRGFLTGYGPILMLVPTRESNPFNKPALLVTDNDLHLKILSESEHVDLKRYFDSLNCTEKFVELVGEVGLVPEHDYHGIVRLELIETFQDDSFGDEGNVCYSSL
jgi:hypothetical protein